MSQCYDAMRAKKRQLNAQNDFDDEISVVNDTETNVSDEENSVTESEESNSTYTCENCKRRQIEVWSVDNDPYVLSFHIHPRN